jgi:hypothetical protein
MAALKIAVGGLPAQMHVEVEPGIEVRAKTVGELRQVVVWPDNLAITGTVSRERGTGKQSQLRHTHLAEIVAWSLPVYARAVGVNCRSADATLRS